MAFEVGDREGGARARVVGNFYTVNALLVVALRAVGRDRAVRMAHRDHAERREVLRQVERGRHLVLALARGVDGHPHGAQAEVDGLEQQVLHRGCHVERRALWEAHVLPEARHDHEGRVRGGGGVGRGLRKGCAFVLARDEVELPRLLVACRGGGHRGVEKGLCLERRDLLAREVAHARAPVHRVEGAHATLRPRGSRRPPGRSPSGTRPAWRRCRPCPCGGR